MLTLFRALSERVKALFVSHAALDFEAEFLAAQAERTAELLRQAERLENEGFAQVADELRQQAVALRIDRPLASILPATKHLQTGVEAVALLPPSDDSEVNLPSTKPRKKGGRP